MVVNLILIFAALIAILLVASYVAEKLGIGKGGGLPPPPMADPQPEPPGDYEDYLWLLRLCIDANCNNLGICCTGRLPAQNYAPLGKWTMIDKTGAQVYWYIFDSVQPQVRSVNPRRIAELLNQLIPGYCFTEGIPFFSVAYVYPLKNGRVVIGVVKL